MSINHAWNRVGVNSYLLECMEHLHQVSTSPSQFLSPLSDPTIKETCVSDVERDRDTPMDNGALEHPMDDISSSNDKNFIREIDVHLRKMAAIVQDDVASRLQSHQLKNTCHDSLQTQNNNDGDESPRCSCSDPIRDDTPPANSIECRHEEEEEKEEDRCRVLGLVQICIEGKTFCTTTDTLCKEDSVLKQRLDRHIATQDYPSGIQLQIDDVLTCTPCNDRNIYISDPYSSDRINIDTYFNNNNNNDNDFHGNGSSVIPMEIGPLLMLPTFIVLAFVSLRHFIFEYKSFVSTTGTRASVVSRRFLASIFLLLGSMLIVASGVCACLVRFLRDIVYLTSCMALIGIALNVGVFLHVKP
eukprot:gb/GECH01014369.1/.p1 GENE.gb/GECH01014369.1/~~gb/GECH01014369.1/.p1  ORF type:complete len:358 (+),score=59.33 gb/GECH01014369.1/:1-1074(+)